MLSATGSPPGALCYRNCPTKKPAMSIKESPVEGTNESIKKIVTQPIPPHESEPSGTSLSFSGGANWATPPLEETVYLVWPSYILPKLRKFLVDRTTSFNGSILMFVHSKGLQQSLALACRHITWQKTSHGEMPIFPTFLSGHWNVLECTAITGRSGLIRPLIISCVGNQDAAVPEPPTEAIWGTIQSLFSRNYSTKWWGCHDPMTNQAPFVRLGRYGSLGKRHVSKSSTFTIPMPAVAAPLPTSISTNTIAP